MRHVTITDLQNDLSSHLDSVEDGEMLVVSRPNRMPLVIAALSEWEGMKETLYLLGNPVNAEHLLASIADCDAGRSFERGLIED